MTSSITTSEHLFRSRILALVMAIMFGLSSIAPILPALAQDAAPESPPPSESSATSETPAPEAVVPVDAGTEPSGGLSDPELPALPPAGDNGAIPPAAEPGDVVIGTGDASVGSAVGTAINDTDIEAGCGDGCPGEGVSLTASTTNIALASTTAELTGNTGANGIATTTNNAHISTGDIDILNIIINYLNRTFIGYGQQYFINVFNRLAEHLDLSGFGEPAAPPAEASCEDATCVVTINTDNAANTSNRVVIDAVSGANGIANAGGDSSITTGDINIANDIFNLANLTVAGSGWYFAVVNIFGELDGDVILPGMTGEEYDRLLRTVETPVPSSQFIIANEDTAAVVNNVVLEGDSGANTIASSASAIIDTGDVTTRSHVFNLVNYSIVGNRWKYSRVNIFGHWDGFVHGLPPGWGSFRDEYGLTLYNDYLPQSNFDEAFARLTVAINNHATTTNDILINALTGGNDIDGAEDALIETGDISILSSIMNFINAAFIGNNWEFSMINVFGDWKGNLAFGKPDLWVTEAVAPKTTVNAGETITYTFLFGNRGDSVARNVRLHDDFDGRRVRVVGASGGTATSETIEWNVGDLPPNSQGSLSYTVQALSAPDDDLTARNTVTVASVEGDRDSSNNSAGGTVTVMGVRTAMGLQSGTSYPSLMVVKTNNASGVVKPGEVVTFTITVRNPSSIALKSVRVRDVMTTLDAKTEVSREIYDLADLQPREQVSINYDLEIGQDIRSDEYINQVLVEGYDTIRKEFLTAAASSKIKVNNPDYRPGGNGPQLTVSRILRRPYYNAGENVAVELIVANNGYRTAVDPVVTERLPFGLTFANWSGTLERSWDLNDMKPGAIERIRYNATVSPYAAAGAYRIEGSVEATGATPRLYENMIKVRSVTVLGASIVSRASAKPVRPRANQVPSNSVITAAAPVSEDDEPPVLPAVAHPVFEQASPALFSPVAQAASLNSDRETFDPRFLWLPFFLYLLALALVLTVIGSAVKERYFGPSTN